ncbi:MAG: hypothetical protein WCK33_02425 [Phycisphaerae bacterium]|jgi:hypothetical protein
MDAQAPSSSTLPSILDDAGLSAGSPQGTPRPTRRGLPGLAAMRRLDASVRAWWRTRMEDPSKRPGTIRALKIAAAALALSGGVGAYFALRPVPQPDYLNGPLDDVFNYTLLTDEFNRLPIEKRLELIGQLVARLRTMDGGDSMLMAGFAAGIAGAARKQIEENASKLAIDMWDKYAKDYTKIPEQDRAGYLDKTFVEFVKTMETVGGNPSDKPDEERLADIRRQVQRDRERMKDPARQPKGEDMGRMFRFMDQNVGGHASPEQRTRGLMMMRDMMRHFRGQDLGTGKALPPK